MRSSCHTFGLTVYASIYYQLGNAAISAIDPGRHFGWLIHNLLSALLLKRYAVVNPFHLGHSHQLQGLTTLKMIYRNMYHSKE